MRSKVLAILKLLSPFCGIALVGVAVYGAVSGALVYQEVILTLILAAIILK